MKITSLDDLVTAAKSLAETTTIAVVEAQDEHTLESVVQATSDGIITPILIGSAEKISAMLIDYGADPSKFRVIDSPGPEESLETAVGLIRAGRVRALMKGNLETAQYMKAIVRKENGLVAGGRLSLIGFFFTPKYHKVFAVSDMALNTYPDLEGKKIIIQNAVRLMRAIGNPCPKVAALSSVEKVNPKMPDAVDAGVLKQMNERGEISGCVVEGPISFDLAMSVDAVRIKGYESPVAGDADILLVPDIVSGNVLVKCLTMFGDARTAGLVVGAKIPVVLTSRSAEASDKYYSIALAACAAAGF